MDKNDDEKLDNYYEKYIGAEVVLPDWKGEKLMGKVRNYIKYDDISTG